MLKRLKSTFVCHFALSHILEDLLLNTKLLVTTGVKQYTFL